MDLPSKLQEILSSISDSDFSDRLGKVYQAAANALAKLTDIDLLRYESNTVDEASSADLALWEEMAPVLRDTVMDVNALLTVIQATFPQGEVGSLDPKTSAAEEFLITTRKRIGTLVAKLGETMRSPQIVSDRWNLLAEVQSFRSRFRDEIGTLVFQTAAAFDFVQRRDVVPGHADEIRGAMQVRATVADLLRVLGARRKNVNEGELEDVQWNTQMLEREMDSFGKTPAYKALRAQDKRALIEFRQRLRSLISESMPSKLDLESIVQDYVSFVQTLIGTLSPEMLKENDLEVWAAAGVQLEQAQLHLDLNGASAANALAKAVELAQGLYGRDEALDAFLRKTRKAALSTLAGPELNATVEVFRELLSNLPVHQS